MRKKKVIKRHPIKPDKKFNSAVVAQLINKVMRKGEKRIAMWIVYRAALIVEEKSHSPFLTVLEGALTNIKPGIEMKRKKQGSSSYRVPKTIDEVRALKIALRWLVEGAKEKKTPQPMFENLAEEIIDAYNKSGGAFKKKENLHKEAMSNMTFTTPF